MVDYCSNVSIGDWAQTAITRLDAFRILGITIFICGGSGFYLVTRGLPVTLVQILIMSVFLVFPLIAVSHFSSEDIPLHPISRGESSVDWRSS